jgi:hypothetical protein
MLKLGAWVGIANFAGTYKLESFEIEENSGYRRPWGKDVHGLLIYTADGYMSVSINKAVETNSENDSKNIFDSILFYSGTYKADEGTIAHQVTQASNPQRIGKTLLRYANVDGDKVTLSSPREFFGIAHLTWKRIAK